MTDRQDKKAQFVEEKKKSPLVWIVIAVVTLVGIGVGAWGLVGSGGSGSLEAVNGMVAIDEGRVADGQAHFFTYDAGSTKVKFFVLKSGDGVVRAALDTCDVCYREQKGYRQEGDFMVCNNCNQKFASDMINEVKGGCNPAPLRRTVKGGQVLIAESDLKQGARYFGN